MRQSVIGEYSGNALIQETVWLGDIPVATLRGSIIYYVHSDHLNAPKKVTQPSNNAVRWSWDRAPFGTTAPNENPSGLGTFSYNLRLPGQFYDAETGLNYNYYRDYDPTIGRYVQSDPIGLLAGVNTYAYVRGAPTRYADRLGLQETDPETDTTGAGENAQKACDAEQERKEAEQDMIAAREREDWEGLAIAEERALSALEKYYYYQGIRMNLREPGGLIDSREPLPSRPIPPVEPPTVPMPVVDIPQFP